MKKHIGSSLGLWGMMAALGESPAYVSSPRKRSKSTSKLELTPKQKKARAKSKRAKKARRKNR